MKQMFEPSLLIDIQRNILTNNNYKDILQTNPNIQIIRNILHKSKESQSSSDLCNLILPDSTYRILQDTVVHETIDRICKNLLSSRKQYKFERLTSDKPKYMRQVNSDQLKKLIIKMMSLFELDNIIGVDNCENIAKWIVIKILYGEQSKLYPEFIQKNVKFLGYFRSKELSKKVKSINDKRGLQMITVQSILSFICITFMIFTLKHIENVKVKWKRVYCWKRPFRKMMINEMKDFRKRYQVKKCDGFKIASAQLKFWITMKNIRPIVFTKKINWIEVWNLKRMNAIISLCSTLRGIPKQTINNNLDEMKEFIEHNMKYGLKLNDFTIITIDISKCFSTLRHSILMKLIEKLIEGENEYYTIDGWGRYNNNRFISIASAGLTKQEAIESMEKKRKRLKGVKEWKQGRIQIHRKATVVKSLQSIINSYRFEIKKQSFEMRNGVPQGHRLSSNFSHLYLSDFEQKYFNHNDRNEIYIGRYEDDFIFCTTNYELLRKRLESLISGTNEYGLRINVRKTQKLANDETMKWCGVDINELLSQYK